MNALRIRFLSFYVKRLFCTDRQFISELHRITKLYPQNEDLYKLAFVHKSASLKLPDGTHVNNERLEFLGDAILDWLMFRQPPSYVDKVQQSPFNSAF